MITICCLQVYNIVFKKGVSINMLKNLLLLISLPWLLFADNLSYSIPLLEKEAQDGSKEAMYKLGYIYEKGINTQVDIKKSLHWYKKMSEEYKYSVAVIKHDKAMPTSFMDDISGQLDPITDNKGSAFTISKVDTDTQETKKLINELYEDRFFGLTPYHKNYMLLYGVANKKYKRYSELIAPNAALTPEQEQYNEYSTKEVEFQISFKKRLTYNLFGWNESIVGAYTQRVWWQVYSKSAPFREMNFEPELFISVPSSSYMDDTFGLKSVRMGYLHQSNGRDGYASRSWNRMQLSGLWQWENLFLTSRLWYKFPEKRKSDAYYNGTGLNANGSAVDPNEVGDDNPNIEEYYGYGDIHLQYLYGKNQFSTMFRYNFGMGDGEKGAVEFSWMYPFFGSHNMFWYTKVFTGYGESLIDYDRSITKASFGFSFSRGLF